MIQNEQSLLLWHVFNRHSKFFQNQYICSIDRPEMCKRQTEQAIIY